MQGKGASTFQAKASSFLWPPYPAPHTQTADIHKRVEVKLLGLANSRSYRPSHRRECAFHARLGAGVVSFARLDSRMRVLNREEVWKGQGGDRGAGAGGILLGMILWVFYDVLLRH